MVTDNVFKLKIYPNFIFCCRSQNSHDSHFGQLLVKDAIQDGQKSFQIEKKLLVLDFVSYTCTVSLLINKAIAAIYLMSPKMTDNMLKIDVEVWWYSVVAAHYFSPSCD